MSGRMTFAPLFKSSDSYMVLRLPEFVVADRALTIELQFRPLSSGDGMLLYTGQTDDGRGDFLSLAVVDAGRHVQLRFIHS